MQLSNIIILSVQVFTIFGIPLEEKDGTTIDETGNEIPVFEGDLEIPYELYKEFYLDEGDDAVALEEMRSGIRYKRGAIRNQSYLWENGFVYYRFYQSPEYDLSQGVKDSIRQVMDYIEGLTCLRFLNARLDQPDSSLLTFREHEDLDGGCSSTSVGRANNVEQFIKLRNCRRGTIIHEIGHAIGFWHEQSRPDRDDYVKILEPNIEDGKLHNFKIRTHEIDSQGSTYDYGSIMHYRLKAFSKNDQPTIEIINETEYEKQERPVVGQRNQFSSRDIDQIKNLYSCSATKGFGGRLVVHILMGMNFPIDDLSYVLVTAFSYNGFREVISTVNVKGTDSVRVWNEKLEFEANLEWSFFRIEVISAHNNMLTMSETIPIVADDFNALKIHCKEPQVCNSKVEYLYTIQCLDKPCENGGKCEYIESSQSFKCTCLSGFEGSHCQFALGRLNFTAQYGKNLPDRDGGWFQYQSDPYIRVVAIDHYGEQQVLATRHIWNTHNPTWNQELRFEKRAWKEIIVRVFEYDRHSRDVPLSDSETYAVTVGQGNVQQELQCYRGKVVFSYSI